jgi:hypothetical protein
MYQTSRSCWLAAPAAESLGVVLLQADRDGLKAEVVRLRHRRGFLGVSLPHYRIPILIGLVVICLSTTSPRVTWVFVHWRLLL